MITREVDPSHDNVTKISKKPNSTSWTSRFKDPRIIPVARAFGGKDRHSKVFTVKGLRDRRVRLSVPAALQLYDLQDKLGLDQPSKVVDWLINEAKHEIDELPPLQMPPIGGVELLKLNALTGLRKDEDPQIFLRGVQKATQTIAVSDEDAVKLNARNFDLNLMKGNGNNFNFGLHQNDFISRSVSLAHSESHHGAQEIQNFNNVMAATLPSSIMYMPLSSQVLVYPPAGLPQYFFHPHNMIATTPEFDPKDINFHTLNMSSENPSSSSRYQFFLPSPNNIEEKKNNKGTMEF